MPAGLDARGGVEPPPNSGFGQTIIERLAGKRIHPTWAVAGGVTSPLSAGAREQILGNVPEAIGIATRAVAWFKRELEKHEPEGKSLRTRECPLTKPPCCVSDHESRRTV